MPRIEIATAGGAVDSRAVAHKVSICALKRDFAAIPKVATAFRQLPRARRSAFAMRHQWLKIGWRDVSEQDDDRIHIISIF